MAVVLQLRVRYRLKGFVFLGIDSNRTMNRNFNVCCKNLSLINQYVGKMISLDRGSVS
jgi:hypothetical protein